MLLELTEGNFSNVWDKNEYDHKPHKTAATLRRKCRAAKRSGMDDEEGTFPPRRPSPIREDESAQCELLWKAVIIQAFCDLSDNGGGHEKRLARSYSFAWFAEASPDGNPTEFETVCELAGLEKAMVLQIVKRIRNRELEITEGMNFRIFEKELPEIFYKISPEEIFGQMGGGGIPGINQNMNPAIKEEK